MSSSSDKEQGLNWSRIFGDRLMNERVRQGVTVESMAEACGLSNSYYRSIEGGKGYFPSFVSLVRIFKALHCSPARLFEGIVEWNELDAYAELKEKLGDLTPAQLKKANAMLDLMFNQ